MEFMATQLTYSEIVPRILQQNLPFLLLDHESLKWHVLIFLFYW